MMQISHMRDIVKEFRTINDKIVDLKYKIANRRKSDSHRGLLMEVKDVGLAAVMIISSMIITYKWLTRVGDSDLVIIISSMLLIGSLAIMIILLDARLRNLENALDAKERSIRINIKDVEENLEAKVEEFSKNTTSTIDELSKGLYR